MRRVLVALVVLGFCFGGEATAAPIFDDGNLIGYWDGDAPLGGGVTAIDASTVSTNHPGTLMNGTTRTAGVFGQAFSFDGSNDYINFGQNTDWNFLSSGAPFTVAGWARINSAAESGGILGNIDAHSASPNRQGMSIRFSSGRIRAGIQNIAGGTRPLDLTSAAALTPGVYQHFAVTFTGGGGGTATIYINGSFDSSTIASAAFTGGLSSDVLHAGAIGTPDAGPSGLLGCSGGWGWFRKYAKLKPTAL